MSTIGAGQGARQATALREARVLVVGAGIMGAGIAQLAAQAGHRVALFDTRAEAARQARDKLAATFDTLVAKGRLQAAAAADTLARIDAVDTLEQAADCGLVIEAIVERVDVKRELLARLEALVAPDCVLASNTSSLSITALARDMRHPERLVGMHFFNPVPLMKLVEVVSGLRSDPAVADQVFELAQAWGKTAVHARSTPGFIVNRIARPYYAETLALLQEQAAAPEVLDACLRAAGFRMGPCELMDLIGHDTNFAVTQAVYEANFFDKRFQPSLVQRELVDGGLLGRKSGRGFYDYAEGAAQVRACAPDTDLLEPDAATRVVVAGRGALADRLGAALHAAGREYELDPQADWCGLRVDGACLRLCDGRAAAELGAEVAVFDLPLRDDNGLALAWSVSSDASAHWQQQAPRWLHLLGWQPLRLRDIPGLVVARTVAMLIHEAADAVHQGVCTPEGADNAMKLGVNYPAGPFEWLQRWRQLGAPEPVVLLDALDHHYRGERYRASPGLREQAWLRQRGASTEKRA
ncbi:MAG: 3-hydroxyacyl-CoA dehydrogenase [Betaproteobacteria bacterium]|nr:3-hydroxyacyl-CoA dehydrogenase [Betaproteobacteria bacterium]